MPVCLSHTLPDWFEVKGYDILRLQAGVHMNLPKKHVRDLLFVVEGICCSLGDGLQTEHPEGTTIAIKKDDTRMTAMSDATVVHVYGVWSAECGSSGTFIMNNAEVPRNIGDPTPYDDRRKTDFDNHYHDCDECWIVTDGSCIAVSEGIRYSLGAGNCLVTPAGQHHDLIEVIEPVRGVYVETTLRGLKQLGHLWKHTHGAAIPINI